MTRVTLRGILLLACCFAACAQTLDDAVAVLAKQITGRLASSETARVAVRNSSSLSAAEAAKIQPALNRALQRRIREPKPIDIAVTIAENLRGYLLVAEIKHEDGTAVEMAEFRPLPQAAAARPAVTIESRLLWEQDAPILDVALSGDQLLVLDTAGVSLYNRNAGKWEHSAAAPIPTNLRDSRGAMEVTGEVLTVHLPGLTCSGSAKLQSSFRCEEGGRFDAARNTLNQHDGHGEFFSTVEIGGDTLVAGVDGRTHVYDTARAPQGAFDGWGSDFVAITACGNRRVLAASSADQRQSDSVTLYDVVNRAPVRVSDPLEFAGAVTALWPSGDGVMAVVRTLSVGQFSAGQPSLGQSSAGKYAAYSLAIHCGR
ncbi:MAG TPA: hypothetical protein VGJ09_10785 [Bryobacteraceae bacterium]